jgi:chemotaxis protein CheD
MTTPGSSDDDPALRGHDPCGAPTAVKINPGEHYVTRNAAEMIVTVLGSCVAACIRDPVAGVGGMNHFMLPESPSGTWGGRSASLRYGNFAMERLVNDILALGGRRDRLEVKVFGGAGMIDGANIGPRNADFVEAYLREQGLPIAAAHLRGDHARRIHYFPLTGRVLMQEMPREEAGTAETDASGAFWRLD